MGIPSPYYGTPAYHADHPTAFAPVHMNPSYAPPLPVNQCVSMAPNEVVHGWHPLAPLEDPWVLLVPYVPLVPYEG